MMTNQQFVSMEAGYVLKPSDRGSRVTLKWHEITLNYMLDTQRNKQCSTLLSNFQNLKQVHETFTMNFRYSLVLPSRKRVAVHAFSFIVSWTCKIEK